MELNFCGEKAECARVNSFNDLLDKIKSEFLLSDAELNGLSLQFQNENGEQLPLNTMTIKDFLSQNRLIVFIECTESSKIFQDCYENQIKSEDVKKIIQEEWKIELPTAYKTLKHNNCIPCFKGGKKYFYDVYKNYPNEYEKAMKKEEEVGYTVFKDISLKELKMKFENDKQWEENQMTLNDFIPCDCWN